VGFDYVSLESEKELRKQEKVEQQSIASKTQLSYLQGCDSHVSLAFFLDVTPRTPYIHQ
jgi:hypothetical protein